MAEIIDSCKEDDTRLAYLSREICRFVCNSGTIPGDRKGKFLTFDRHCGTSGMFIARISKRVY